MIEIILSVIGVIVLFFIVVMLIDGNRFVVKRYQLTTDKTKHSYKFVILADLHGKEYGIGNEKLLRAIENQKPDGILIAGDMLTAKPGENFNHVLGFLGSLSEKYPVYYGNGNHEYRLKLYPETYGTMAEEYGEGLDRIGIFPLCNERNRPMEDNIVIYGLEIDREFYKRGRKVPMSDRYILEKLGKPDKSNYNILLAHNPDYFEAYADWGADLVISGHNHGGVMRLPWIGGVIAPSLRIFPKYSGGKYQSGNSTMLLSNGLGSHSVPMRIFNPGQLVVLELISD